MPWVRITQLRRWPSNDGKSVVPWPYMNNLFFFFGGIFEAFFHQDLVVEHIRVLNSFGLLLPNQSAKKMEKQHAPSTNEINQGKPFLSPKISWAREKFFDVSFSFCCFFMVRFQRTNARKASPKPMRCMSTWPQLRQWLDTLIFTPSTLAVVAIIVLVCGIPSTWISDEIRNLLSGWLGLS